MLGFAFFVFILRDVVANHYPVTMEVVFIGSLSGNENLTTIGFEMRWSGTGSELTLRTIQSGRGWFRERRTIAGQARMASPAVATRHAQVRAPRRDEF